MPPLPRAGWGAAFCLAGALLLAGPRADAQALPTGPPPAASDATTVNAPLLDLSLAEMQPDILAPAVPDTYRLGVDDLISVFVYRMPELSSQMRVGSDGEIRVPLARVAFPALGKTSLELSRSIADELKSEGLASSPFVRVVVRQVDSRPIIISGAVRNPMVIQAVRPMSLLEVISRAGGVFDAGERILVTQADAAGPVTRELSLSGLLQNADASSGIELTGGETIRVLPARYVYTVGALLKPGAFPVQTGEPITVLRAIALSEGFSSSTPADKSHAMIVKFDAQGAQTRQILDLNAILKHNAEDPVLAPGDMLYVPENGRRKAINASIMDLGQAMVLLVGYNLKP